MTISCPRIVIAGTGSGVGKTSLALALVLAFRRRGLAVQTFKVGPDFLDPSYLALVSGRPCYNLDGWMSSRAYVLQSFARAVRGADIAIIEGVMGMFDGASASDSGGSTAEMARWLRSPVLLVADAKGVARSFAAVIKGFDGLAGKPRIAAVVANAVGGPEHAQWLKQSLKSLALPPLLGALPKNCFPALPRRHLGLVTANYAPAFSRGKCQAFAAACARHVDLDAVLRLARRARPLSRSLTHEKFPPQADPPMAVKNGRDGSESRPKTQLGDDWAGCLGETSLPLKIRPKQKKSFNIRLAVARDAAFHFYYPDNIALLRALGARIIYFSPLADTKLPGAIDAIYLGGGYPELFAEEISANRPLRDAVREFAGQGGAIYAECGGLIYLAESIAGVDGKKYPMAGVLPVKTKMLPRLKRLGYAQVTLARKTAWGPAGVRLRGHEFHYSEIVNPAAWRRAGWQCAYRVRYCRSKEKAREGFRKKNVLASYIHLHFASRPDAAKYFLDWCRGGRNFKTHHGLHG